MNSLDLRTKGAKSSLPEVKPYVDAGMSYAAIGRRFCVNRSTVYRKHKKELAEELRKKAEESGSIPGQMTLWDYFGEPEKET